jgi:hypothetical protein
VTAVFPIDASKLFPCPVCLVRPGEECWPRNVDTDVNWVHTFRRKAMEMNAKAGIAETVVF